VARTLTLADLEPESLRGTRVLVRVDLNVPLTDQGEVADHTRILASVPTIRHLMEAGARTLLVSHFGRPKDGPDPAFSLAPVARALSSELGVPVPLLTDSPGTKELAATVEGMSEGEVALLENIRFHPGETTNAPELVDALARLCEVFVGDAFGAVHRAHASTEGLPRRLRETGGRAVAGFLVERELRFLRGALASPEEPFVAVMGGAKISGKIDLIESIIPRVQRLLIGGAMANTFFRALGLDTGESLVEPDRVEMAERLLERAGEAILLPVDCVVAEAIEAEASTRVVDRDQVSGPDRIADIGPRTRTLFAQEITGARTLLWNGPMGVFELAPFAEGTLHVARAMAEAADDGATVVVGGGDSLAAAQAAGVTDRMSHVSTGGGASLDLLAGKDLPGVDVLETEQVEGGSA
jgi:phosphoglycerate kinase